MMSNKIKNININNHKQYFLDDIFNINSFDPNNIEIDKIHIKIFLFTMLDM